MCFFCYSARCLFRSHSSNASANFPFPQIFLILTNRPHGPRVSCPLSQAVGWFLAGFPEQVETAVAETGFDPTTWRFGYHLPYHFPVSTFLSIGNAAGRSARARPISTWCSRGGREAYSSGGAIVGGACADLTRPNLWASRLERMQSLRLVSGRA